MAAYLGFIAKRGDRAQGNQHTRGNDPASQFITADSWDQQISTGGGNDPLQVRSSSPDSIANNDHSTLGIGLSGCKNRKLTACAALSKLWLERPGETRISFTEKSTRSFA